MSTWDYCNTQPFGSWVLCWASDCLAQISCDTLLEKVSGDKTGLTAPIGSGLLLLQAVQVGRAPNPEIMNSFIGKVAGMEFHRWIGNFMRTRTALVLFLTSVAMGAMVVFAFSVAADAVVIKAGEKETKTEVEWREFGPGKRCGPSVADRPQLAIHRHCLVVSLSR